MTDHALSDRAYMTPLLNRIADAAGENAALKLGMEKAGEKIYIAAHMTVDNWLAELIGIEAATAMATEFGGQNLLMPAALAGNRRKTSTKIAQLIDKGHSNNEIVRVTGVSRRTVTNHRGKRQKPDDQGSLF